MIGSDVVALYPSLTADRTAKMIRKKIEESDIKFEGFDIEKGKAYLGINRDELDEEQRERMKRIIPEKKATTGTRPTMTSVGMKWGPQKQWELERIETTKIENRQIIAAVVEVAFKVLFKNFTYKF